MSFYRSKNILVTGGAGFLGSNLVDALAQQGANVTVLDNFHPDYGANEFNLAGTMSKIRLVRGDILDRGLVADLCAKADVVFHIAAQCSHVDSMTDPWLDLRFNCEGTLSVLEGVRLSRNHPSVVYAGTRAIIGAPLESPASEKTLPNPVDIYGVHKYAAEWYGAVYARAHRIPFVSLRLTNCYGERHQMKNGKYGILNWFISLVLQGKPVKIYGAGEQLRDYLYVGDAIGAFLKAGDFAEVLRRGQDSFPDAQMAGSAVPFALFNITYGDPRRFGDCARLVVEMGHGTIESIPWPKERAVIETGDFIASNSAAKRILGWAPGISFEAGLKKTFSYYQEHLKRYL